MNKQPLNAALAMCLALSTSACGEDGSRREQPGDAGVDGGSVAAMDGGADADLPPDLPCDPAAAPSIPPLALTTVVDDVDRLVFAAQPKETTDWYLVQQSGRVLVLHEGALRTEPFLDLTAQISNPSGGDEYGLLGIAFPPDYEQSGRFYVAITPTAGDGAYRDRVVEYRRSASDPYRADSSSERVILELEPSAGNHNGGHVTFGPDGMLYVGTGDGGGSCNDEKAGAPQDPHSLFGKILRLDPSTPGLHAAAGNPFSEDTGDPRVLHYGLRNPYRFSFDSESGALYVGDVGQGRAEELSYAAPGQQGLNFGWAAFEGEVMGTCAGRTLGRGVHTPPIFATDRTAPSSDPFDDYVSIIAGHVYRGHALPALRGVFLFGDYEGENMGFLRQCETRTSPVATLLKRRDQNRPNQPSFRSDTELRTLTAIVEDSAGELYLVANLSTLMKVVPAP